MSGGTLSEADRLILEAATGARKLSRAEIQRVLEHVAQAGFDPAPHSRATGLSGLQWQSRTLKGSDRITAAEQHYLKHVVKRQEWPEGTSFEAYLQSIRQLVLSPTSGVFTSRYRGYWQLGAIGPSGDLRGPRGGEWILVEYRLETGHWVTAYQPGESIRALHVPGRTDLQWLHRPPHG